MIKKLFFGFFISFFTANSAWAALKYEASYFLAVRGVYIFSSEEAEPAKIGSLLGGSDIGSTSGKTHALRPAGTEFKVSKEGFSDSQEFYFSIRWMAGQFKAPGSFASQYTNDFTYSGAYLFKNNYFAAGAGLRLRSFYLADGKIPNFGQAGLFVQLSYTSGPWGFLLEPSPMAISLGSITELGTQRDANTLRLRVSRDFEVNPSGFKLRPFVEFFHSHTSFFASTLIADTAAIFIDDASLIFGLSAEF
jgi:hypothetical protein